MATNDHEICTTISRLSDSIEAYERKITEFMKSKDEAGSSNANIGKMKEDLEDMKGGLNELKMMYNRLDDSKKERIYTIVKDLLKMLNRRVDKIKCDIDLALEGPSRSGGKGKEIIRQDLDKKEGDLLKGLFDKLKYFCSSCDNLDDLEVQQSGVSTRDDLEVQQSGASTRDDLEVQLSTDSTTADLQVRLSGDSTVDDLEVQLSGVSTMDNLEQQEIKGSSSMASKYPDDSIEKRRRIFQFIKHFGQLERRISELDTEKKELEDLQKSLNEISKRFHQSNDHGEIKNIWKRFDELKIKLYSIKDVSSSGLDPGKDDVKLSESGESSDSRTGIEGKGKEVKDVASDSTETEEESQELEEDLKDFLNEVESLDLEEDLKDFLNEVENYEELEELR